MNKTDVTILLPTYNEAKNVAPLLRSIHRQLRDLSWMYEVVFIDDSTDETPTVIENLSKTYPNIRLVHRPSERRTGLATAFVEGFSYASGKYILCMDSDLQHPPKVIPKLIRTIFDTGSGIVVATRYRKGGGADGLNTFYRRLVSHFCRLAAWLVLPTTRKTTDPGSGFFILKKSLIKNLSFEGLQGFKILIDLLSRMPAEVKVEEVPYVFAKRENDKSKATFKQGIAFLLHIIALRKRFLVKPDIAIRSIRNVESALPKPRYSFRTSSKMFFLVVDVVIMAAIAFFGWFLIGYYADYNYIYTGYEDWIYHAFRVQSIQEYGIPSWNHVWSNGLNYWRMYQYVAHSIILLLVTLTGLPVTKVLVLSLIGIYIGLRVVLYALLRFLGVSRVFSGLSVIASYTVVQEWGSMQDYSIYVAFAVLPLYVVLWIKTFQNKRWVYVLTAITGAIWTFHPVLGFSTSILLGFLVLFTSLKNETEKLVRMSILYLVSSAPFLVQYFTAGYFFTNPLFKSYIYLSLSVLSPYHGFSMAYWMLFGFAWILVIWRSHVVTTWAKVLLLYASFYLVLIYLGQNNFLPDFLVQFQFSRGITAVAIVLVFAFGTIFQQALGRTRSQVVLSVFAVFVAASAVHAVDIASRYYVSPPVQEIQDPVAIYFSDHRLPTGSVFVDNVSQSTYFAPKGIRYVTSYNEHMQPHPYSTRLRVLMRNSLGYTGISKSHISNIENYATVLGIEYLFLPETSPLVDGLTRKENAYFDKVTVIESDPLPDAIAVLQYNRPIIQAFVAEKGSIPVELLDGDIPKPTLHVATYQPWDRRIASMADFMRSDAITPISLEFIDTDRLKISPEGGLVREQYQDPLLIVTQSYDKNWRVEGGADQTDSIDPTPLRFIAVDLVKQGGATSFDLKNSWPVWHWPVQSIGITMVLATFVFTIGGGKRRNI